MGKGGQGEVRDREQAFMWEEIRKHRNPDDTWVVLENKVYDVSNFKKRHPGGWQLLEDHAGQDATIPFQLYHMNMNKVRKFMKPLQIGVLGEETWANERDRKLDQDFYKLWEKCKEMGLFKPSYLVHFLLIAQIIIYEAVGYWIISTYGTGWIPFLAAAFFVGASWTHTGYSMHDYSHRAVTHNANIDYIIQLALFSFQSGFSANFWTEYHSRHHSKPNLYEKDPTININEQFFVIGHTQAGRRAKTDAKQETKSFAFNLQHNYWFLLGPPLYIPVRFQIASVLYSWRRNHKVDLVLMAGCALRFMYFYLPHMNILNFLVFMWIARQIMSHWFVWISLSNHLALHPEDDTSEGKTWFESQVKGTINLPFGYFYEWYTGTLNLQIEHHLFPYMPRENFRKIVPLVKDICKKHDIEYKETKTLFEAFYMVFDMLRQSGSTWHHEYYKALAGM